MRLCRKLLFKSWSESRGEFASNISRILLVSLVGEGFGGLETHVVCLYKELHGRGHRPLLLVAANSLLHRRVLQEGMDFYAVRWSNCRGFRHLLPFIFNEVCKHHSIRVIHCNNRFEVPSAIRAAQRFSARVILNYHVPARFDMASLRGLDAFISPVPEIVEYVRERSQLDGLAIQHIESIPPLFDAEKFLAYRSGVERNEWFAATFNICLRSCPIICVIGNMVRDLEHKNYPLFFEAMAQLIHQRSTAVQAVLVGDGPVRCHLEGLAEVHGIQDCVYFLGHTVDSTADILHYSDMLVLASSREAFGIVYLEAGLMHKPAIGARETGAEIVIVPERTGLLFDNGSASSLAAAIQEVVDHPEWAQTLGCQAYEHVTQTYLPSVVIRQYEKLYSALARST